MAADAQAGLAFARFSLSRWRGGWLRRGLAVVVAAGLAVGVSLLSTSWWAGEAKLLYVQAAPAGIPDVASLGSAGSALQSLGLAPGSQAALLPEILRSRSLVSKLLADTVRVDGEAVPVWSLYTEHEQPTPSQMDRLQEGFRETRVQAHHDARTDIVRLQLLAPGPELAARLTNRLAELLNDRLVANAIERARRQKDFIEGRLAEVEEELEAAEVALRGFREANRSIQSSPALRLEEQRLIREVALNEQVFTTLVAQRELARIEEVKNLPVIDVLDAAVPPVEAAAPRPAFRAAAAVLLVLFVLFALDALAWIRRQPNA